MPSAHDFQPLVTFDLTAVVPASGNTTPEIDLGGCSLVGLKMPATFTGTSIGVQMSDISGGTYVNVQDGTGNDLSIAVAASKYIPISNLSLTAGLKFIKLVSSSTESSARTILLATRPV